jgi:hypothetical protein
MRKFSCLEVDEQPRRRPSRLPVVALVLLLLLLSPILYESSAICIAAWKTALGTYTPVETPVLDSIKESWRTGRLEASSWVRPVFHSYPWKASVVVPFAFVWTMIAAIPLRK